MERTYVFNQEPSSGGGNKFDIMAMLPNLMGGKSREDVYSMLSADEKRILNDIAARHGVSRGMRRKLERDARKGRH